MICSLVMVCAIVTHSFAGGWCGQSRKEDCGGWVVQFNLFNGGSFGGNDCVSYNNCVNYAKWDWSSPGAWSQLLLEKEGFCGKNYRISNTADFNVKYNGSFSSAWGKHRLAIVSWGKTADNCNWTTNNLYELYIHERSFNEGTHTEAYNSWCTYKGQSGTCSGSKYHLYDCGNQIIGRSIRCWRINTRMFGTTNVDCLWETWRNKGIAPDVYYYFTEVGAEVAPSSGGRFELKNNPNMTRVAQSSGGGGGGGGSLVNKGIYRLKCQWGNKMLHNTNSSAGSNVTVKNRDNSQWSMQWILRKISGNNYRIQARWGNKYLNSTGGGNNANVNIANLNNGANAQKWELKNISGNSYRLRSHRGSKYLTGKNTNGGNVTVHSVNNGWSSQKWTLEYTGSKARFGDDGQELLPEASKDLQVYSPTGSDFMTVTGLNLKSAALYDLSGKLKWENSQAKELYNIKVNDLESGIYVIKAMTVHGETKTHKLILR